MILNHARNSINRIGNAIINQLRNIIAIPVATSLGMLVPSIFLKIIIFLDESYCWVDSLFLTSHGAQCLDDKGDVFFMIPYEYYWIYLHAPLSGGLAGFVMIFLTLKIAKDEGKLLYYFLFIITLSLTVLAIYFNAQKPIVFAIPTILSNLITFGIAGIYPLYMAINDKKIDFKTFYD